VARLGLDGRRVTFSLAHGQAVHSTLRKLSALKADLIVVGKQRRSMIAALLVGSVSRRLLARVDCDMVIVPCVPSKPVVSLRSPFARREVSTVQHNGRFA
jgi:nucleotide-binding universal stress UspA family protein